MSQWNTGKPVIGGPVIIENLSGPGMHHMLYQGGDEKDRFCFLLLKSENLIKWE